MEQGLLHSEEGGYPEGPSGTNPYGDEGFAPPQPSSLLRVVRYACIGIAAADLFFGILGQIVIGGFLAKKDLVFTEVVYYMSAFESTINWTLLVGLLALWSAIHWRHFTTLAYLIIAISQFISYCTMFAMLSHCSKNSSGSSRPGDYHCESGDSSVALDKAQHDGIMGITVLLFFIQTGGLVMFSVKHWMETRETSKNNNTDLAY